MYNKKSRLLIVLVNSLLYLNIVMKMLCPQRWLRLLIYFLKFVAGEKQNSNRVAVYSVRVWHVLGISRPSKLYCRTISQGRAIVGSVATPQLMQAGPMGRKGEGEWDWGEKKPAPGTAFCLMFPLLLFLGRNVCIVLYKRGRWSDTWVGLTLIYVIPLSA